MPKWAGCFVLPGQQKKQLGTGQDKEFQLQLDINNISFSACHKAGRMFRI
jgi:hypothetical protein